MTDNRTTERLMAMLEERGIAWKKRRGYIRWSKQTEYGVTHYQAWPCFDGTITLTVRDEYGLKPEQAIAATLGSEREKELESLVRGCEEEAALLRSAIEKVWPVVTKHTSVGFWGPIENELRKVELRTRQAESKEDE